MIFSAGENALAKPSPVRQGYNKAPFPFLAQRLALQRVSWSGHRPLHRPVGAFALA